MSDLGRAFPLEGGRERTCHTRARRTRPRGGLGLNDHGETADPPGAGAGRTRASARSPRDVPAGRTEDAGSSRLCAQCLVDSQLGRRIIVASFRAQGSSGAGELRRGLMPECRLAVKRLRKRPERLGTVRRCPPRGEPERSMDAPLTGGDGTRVRFAWLPRPGTLGYHLLLGAVALFILGPLGGITAAYMNFSLGILRRRRRCWPASSAASSPTATAPRASTARTTSRPWPPRSPTWRGWRAHPGDGLAGDAAAGGLEAGALLRLHRHVRRSASACSTRRSWSTGCSSSYPSGHAVANILRALTDARLLRRSIGKLGGGTGAGIAIGALVSRVAPRWSASASPPRPSAPA